VDCGSFIGTQFQNALNMNARAEESVTDSQPNISGTRVKRLILIGCIVSFSAAVGFSITYSRALHRSGVTYEGKSLEQWFYRGRTNFLTDDKERINALKAMGTNTFAFLLSNLRERRGNSLVYFKLYRMLPRLTQRRLPYPISEDDIRAISINYLFKLQDLPGAEFGSVAECTPNFGSPRLRLFSLGHFIVERQGDPAFLPLCRKLLNDNNSAVRLDAALCVANSESKSDLTDPRLFPILIDGLQNKALRDADLDLRMYTFGQPPGGSGMRRFPSMPSNMPDEDKFTQKRIIRALEGIWFRGYLTSEQKEVIKRLEKEQEGNLKE
jgi:hypothetical protein